MIVALKLKTHRSNELERRRNYLDIRHRDRDTRGDFLIYIYI
jgi:hypothetical protein